MFLTHHKCLDLCNEYSDKNYQFISLPECLDPKLIMFSDSFHIREKSRVEFRGKKTSDGFIIEVSRKDRATETRRETMATAADCQRRSPGSSFLASECSYRIDVSRLQETR